MPNNAMIVAVDRIAFTWPRAKKLRLYAVGIAADNRGKVLVTEPPGSVGIRHLPRQNRPAVWDFGGDGYAIYQRTGGLADIVVAHLLVVRSRERARRAGAIVEAVAGSSEAQSVIDQTSAALTKAKSLGLAATRSLSLVLPVLEIVGKLISAEKDTLLQTISGSMFFDAERKRQDAFSQTIKSPDGNMEVEADVFLFDSKLDKDSVAETDAAETSLQADNLMFVKSGKK